MASAARDRAFKRYRCLKAAHRVKKIDIHARLDILAANRPALRPRVLPEPAAQIAKKIAEIVHVKFVAAAGSRRLSLPLLIAPRLLGIEPGSKARLAELII